MRLFALALPLIAALVLAVPATAAKPTTEFTGPAVFTSTPSADSIHRDLTLTVPFTYHGTVAVEMTITYNGEVVGPIWSATYRGHGSTNFTWLIPGTDDIAPVPGDTISYYLQLVQTPGPNTVVLDDLQTATYTVT
jgi:hypothetical protein